MFSTQTYYGPEKDVLGDKVGSKHCRSLYLNEARLKSWSSYMLFYGKGKFPDCSNQFRFMATKKGEKNLICACVTENEMSQPTGNDSFFLS